MCRSARAYFALGSKPVVLLDDSSGTINIEELNQYVYCNMRRATLFHPGTDLCLGGEKVVQVDLHAVGINSALSTKVHDKQDSTLGGIVCDGTRAHELTMMLVSRRSHAEERYSPARGRD